MTCSRTGAASALLTGFTSGPSLLSKDLESGIFSSAPLLLYHQIPLNQLSTIGFDFTSEICLLKIKKIGGLNIYKKEPRITLDDDVIPLQYPLYSQFTFDIN